MLLWQLNLQPALPGAMVGTAAGTSTVSGTLAGAAAVAGTAAGVGALVGTLKGAGAASGSAAGTSTISGSLGASAALSGTAAGTSSVSGTLTGGDTPVVVVPRPDPGEGGRRRKTTQREFERDTLREIIEAAVSPVEGPAEVVQEPRQVTVRPAAGSAVSIPVPPAFDAAEVARMVSAALGRAVQAAEEVAAQARAAETVRLELERLRRRRRQDEELLLLM